ncbi:alpha-ribazole-5-phosphate synthase [Chryseomicrobium excrementi]|uniref:Alpha-ribazole-5-phosphate synthase n=1 Tax=Chryseomicrobium excrementi TaxID=2041346 RepID=A0A2M9F0G7_9BACL|nr:alpha-ribazole-5-phosphate synthase [Chryseomicrobium excrementi]PJK16949.1 alpha-ribazole-5-phosphate synthase [Chryseomicrobium excrementi]
MRHAVSLGGGLWMGMDNSAGIGEKPQDIIQAPNKLVSYMAARVALLELWCAGAEPNTILLTNFTGESAWQDYEKGIQQVFDEIETPLPPLAGSTESNIETLQSGLAVQLIGRITQDIDTCGDWYLIGSPLVGQAVLERADEVVSLGELQKARQSGAISYVHPCGSGGVTKELERLGIVASVEVPEGSAGPSTCVLVRSSLEEVELRKRFTAPVLKLG